MFHLHDLEIKEIRYSQINLFRCGPALSPNPLLLNTSILRSVCSYSGRQRRLFRLGLNDPVYYYVIN